MNSSVRGLYTMPGTPAYNASKHALETFVDGLRLDMKKFGVKVALVEPGKYGTATAIVSPEQVSRLQQTVLCFCFSFRENKAWQFVRYNPFSANHGCSGRVFLFLFQRN